MVRKAEIPQHDECTLWLSHDKLCAASQVDMQP